MLRPSLAVLTVAVATATVALTSPAGALPRTARAPLPSLTISPLPGTPDASPQTQISILGARPSSIRSVRVVGALSGSHRGALRPYSGDQGASWVTTVPFTPGERVSATVVIAGRHTRRFAFTIARPGTTLPLLKLTSYQIGKLDYFVSAPRLPAPQITVLKPSPNLPGEILLTPLPSPVVHPGLGKVISINPVGPGGPMIVNGRGQLVWFAPLKPPEVAANLQVERYRGRPVLTWWQGGVTPDAYGRGVGIIADRAYRTVATVRAGNGYRMDLHEFTLTPSGDALFTVYAPILVHLPGTAAGMMSPLLDAIVQEVDVRTGLVVWEWHAYGHIPLRDSYATPANSSDYDAFHINSVAPLADGRVLISARDTSAIYDVARSGRIVWTLGGKASSFRLSPDARFFFQHDARMLPDGELSMFDDEGGPPFRRPSSRGLILALHRRSHTATVAGQYRRPGRTSAESEGSLDPQPDGGVFLGFGSEPFFTQFSAAGQRLFDARLPFDDGSYRVVRQTWNATPHWRPQIATFVDHSVPATYVSVSWNGATTVRRWQVLGGRSARALAPLRTVADSGFQTVVTIDHAERVVQVRALDLNGRVLARTPVTTPTALTDAVRARFQALPESAGGG